MSNHESSLDFLPAMKQRSSLWMGIGMLIFIASMVFSSVQLWTGEKKIRRNADVIAEQERKIALQQVQLRDNQQRIDNLAPAALKSFGWEGDVKASQPSTKEIAGSLAANDAIQQLVAVDPVPARGRRVIYFAKDADVDLNQQLFIESLKELGFDVEVRRPINSEVRTNAMWAGSNVPEEDRQLVALALIRAGYPLQLIGTFRSPSPANADIIQIGANPNHVRQRVLGISDVAPRLATKR